MNGSEWLYGYNLVYVCIWRSKNFASKPLWKTEKNGIGSSIIITKSDKKNKIMMNIFFLSSFFLPFQYTLLFITECTEISLVWKIQAILETGTKWANHSVANSCTKRFEMVGSRVYVSMCFVCLCECECECKNSPIDRCWGKAVHTHNIR